VQVVPTRLLGRSAELDVIRSELDRIGTGPGGAVSIVGDPGIGKTALLDRALSDASERGWEVLRVGSSPAEQQVPWSGLMSLFDAMPSEWVGELTEQQQLALAVAKGEHTGAGAPADLGPFVAASLRTLIRRVCSRVPAVIGVDDLQWVDPASASAIAAAMRTLRNEHIAVLAATRRTADHRIDLARIFGAHHVALEPTELARSDVQHLLRQRGIVVTAPMLDDVVSMTAGNPLHTCLLAEQIERNGWTHGQLPASITVGYHVVFDQLAETTRATLECAAVHGSIDVDVLAGCLPDVDVEEALIDAERAGLVGAAGAGVADAIGFTHPMVPAAINERVGPVRRRRLHRVLADTLPVDDEMRAVHLGASTTQPDLECADALDASAQRALARGARHSAGERFRRAAELTPADADDDRWRRTLAAADAFFGAGALDEADVLSTSAFDGASNPMQLALAGGVRTQVLAARQDLIETHAFVADLLERLVGWPMLRGFLGRARVRLEQIFDMQAALETAEAFREEMEIAGLHDLETEFRVAAANCRFVAGEPVDTGALWNIARPIVNAADFIGAGWMALEVLVWGCHDDDIVFLALDQFEQGATAAGAAQSLAKVYDFRGNHLIRLGRWQEGEAEMRRAVDAADLSELTASMAGVGLAWLLAATGRSAEAADTLATSSAAMTASEKTPLLAASHLSCLGFIELCAGRWEDAAETLNQAWSAADKLGMGDLCALPFRVDLVEALVLCGRVGESRDRAERIVELAARSGRVAALMQADRAEVLVGLASGDVDGATLAGQRGLAHHAHVDLPIERARLQLALGSALRRGGRRQAARAALADAASIFGQLGAAPFLERAEGELVRLGGHRDPSALTPTEEQIARLVADGRSNAEVAAALVISVRTVESNLTRVYRKLQLRSRSELAATMRERS
jgi:DNA-binding CsgD family transcriptional regulator/tetratricopeptide (TPR) repeat protein